MRIISGKLGGQHFESPSGHRTHPMSDKIRGALFNTLGDVSGLTIFDAFGGSGAIAFEALSRGCISALITDNSKPAQLAIEANIAKLRLGSVAQLAHTGAGIWSNNNLGHRFDLVVCDPPYDKPMLSLLTQLAERHTRTGGIFIVSLPPDAILDLGKAIFKQLATKNYGDATLAFWRKIA